MSGGPHQHSHGRQGQPNPGWNPLQLASFFPGRPQVAHMSSERPISHSPLTWHTPTPPDHQKSAPNPYRHTPTPPDVQALKAGSTLPYRHTPTPPDLKSFRHTPTPPDVAHGLKTSGVLHYRHTPPPPDIHKGAPSPLFNLQQMIPDGRVSRDSLRDNLGFSRHSPGLTHGSMDLSVSRSPRNGSQNGETIAPISLSVRDATKINSLDSSEISKLHQPLMYSGKPLDMKPSSPTINSMSQRSNSPKSPMSNSKRPVKRVDSILERVNSVGDGVVITPVQHTPSPQSVIVSAHSLEDSNSRGSSSSVSITHMTGIPPYYACEAANMERVTPPHPHNSVLHPPHSEPVPITIVPHTVPFEITSKVTTPDSNPKQPSPLPQSVIKESTAHREDNSTLQNSTNEDSNESTSDSGKQRRKRKQSKTSKATNDDEISNPDIPTTGVNEDSGKTESIQAINHSVETSSVEERVANRLSDQMPKVSSPITSVSDAKANGLLPEEELVSAPVITKTRRKNSSESETIDNIAAMIASTENSSNICLQEKSVNNVTELIDPIASTMHTEQLKDVLCSPEAEHSLETNTDICEVQSNTTPVKSSRQKRNSRSQSTELSQSNPNPNVERRNIHITKPNFVEVENELEKMFAGIEKNDPEPSTGMITENFAEKSDKNANKKTRSKKQESKTVAVTSQDSSVIEDTGTKKNCKKNKSGDSVNNRRKRSANNVATPSKKLKRDKSSEKCKLELLSHRDAYDSGSNASSSKSRGPYVQIKGPRDSPLSVNVINTPVQDEDGDRPLQKIKTLKTKSSLNSDSDFKNKVKSKGLHSSTLSMKYDATTIDTSWVCVFCKRGPHTGGGTRSGNEKQMGDLFGPYIITSDCPDFHSMVSDPQDRLFKNKVKAGTFSQNKQAKGRKSKVEVDVKPDMKAVKEELYVGMTEAGQGGYEVWLHEDCAVWAPGLYLVGAKIVGLESAVWGSCAVKCDHCKLNGASIACIKRGCNKCMHVNCARTEMWSLSEETFRVYCREHSIHNTP